MPLIPAPLLFFLSSGCSFLIPLSFSDQSVFIQTTDVAHKAAVVAAQQITAFTGTTLTHGGDAEALVCFLAFVQRKRLRHR